MENSRRMWAHAAALMTIFIWGTTFVSTKVLLRDFSPLEILLTRFVIGYVFLQVIYRKKIIWERPSREIFYVLAGLCGVTLYFLLENIALTYTLASNVGVVVCVSPFLTAILASVFLKGEKQGGLFYVGFAVAISGIAMMSFSGNRLVEVNPLGDFLALLAALVWSLYSILMKVISRFQSDMVAATRRIFFYGIVLMLPVLWLVDEPWSWVAFEKPVNWINILYLGLGASAICFVSWNWTLRILGAVKVSVYIYLVPVITVMSSALILGEPLTWMSISGTLLTLAGLVMSGRKPRGRKA